MATEPNPKPKFRSDIPSYAAPDRDTWFKKTGAAPFELEDVPLKYLTRARGAVVRDIETINFDKAVSAAVRMDTVNETVAGLWFDASDGPMPIVFFDPQTDSFWAYPAAAERGEGDAPGVK
jgi:hypothetical protein